MPGAGLAAGGLENLPGDDEGLDAPLGQVVRELEIGVGKVRKEVVPNLPHVVQRAFQGASPLGLRPEDEGPYAFDYRLFLAFPDGYERAPENLPAVGPPLDFEEAVHLGHRRERDGLRPRLLRHALDDVGELPPGVGPAPLEPYPRPRFPQPVVAGVVVAFDPSLEIPKVTGFGVYLPGFVELVHVDLPLVVETRRVDEHVGFLPRGIGPFRQRQRRLVGVDDLGRRGQEVRFHPFVHRVEPFGGHRHPIGHRLLAQRDPEGAGEMPLQVVERDAQLVFVVGEVGGQRGRQRRPRERLRGDRVVHLVAPFVAIGAFVGLLHELYHPHVYGVGLDLVAGLPADLHERLPAFRAGQRIRPQDARLRDVPLEVDALELPPPGPLRRLFGLLRDDLLRLVYDDRGRFLGSGQELPGVGDLPLLPLVEQRQKGLLLLGAFRVELGAERFVLGFEPLYLPKRLSQSHLGGIIPRGKAL